MVRLIALLCLQAYFLTEAFGIPLGLPGTCATALPTMSPGLAIDAYPMSMATPFINNLQVSPTISELVPSLQYGDMTLGGDLPIGGTIKVCGCFPVYGTIAVDGALPSAGTAVVDDMFGRQPFEVRCGAAYF